MAICNVFKELTKSNGTFFTFSQYAEDLTKHQSNNSYKVIPSRFICCDVDYSSFNNKTLPNLLQNNFENGCSFLRDNLLENWTPEISKNLFWNEIGEKLLLSDNSNSIVYCGDINIQSYSEQDNIGYNEIYCYIPNDAKKMKFNFGSKNTSKNTPLAYNKDFICGYDSNDLDFNGLLDIECVFNQNGFKLNLNGYGYQYDSKYDHKCNINSIQSEILKDANLFKFNTVVVFYDISNGDVKYENIPLGMFVTGTIYEGKMGGEITKYINNGDIYYSGTSYGLRICNRFVVSPNSTELQDTTVNSEEDGDYPALAQVMSAMTDSQSKMDEVINSIHKYQDGIKEHLAQFKDSRVNVPYIRYINDDPYWFVNGTNTGVYVCGGEILEEVKNKLNECEDIVSEIQSEVDSNSLGVKTLLGQVSSLNEKVDKLEEKVKEIDQIYITLNSFDEQFGELWGKFDIVDGEIRAIEDEINTIESKIRTIEGKIREIQSEVNSNSLGVKTLFEQVSSLEEKVKEINQISNTLGSFEEQFNILWSKFDVVDGEIRAIEDETNLLENNIKSLQEKVGYIGDNLLTGTHNGSGWENYDSFNNGEFYKDNPSGTPDQYICSPKNMIITPGTYTISFDIKTSGFTKYNSSFNNGGIQFWLLDYDYNPAYNYKLNYDELSSDNYKRFYHTFTVSETYDKAYIRIDNDGDQADKLRTELWVRNIKLEKGDKATPYSIIDDINLISSDINNLQETVDLKQNSTDESLNTKNKNIVGAINEVYTQAMKSIHGMTITKKYEDTYLVPINIVNNLPAGYYRVSIDFSTTNRQELSGCSVLVRDTYNKLINYYDASKPFDLYINEKSKIEVVGYSKEFLDYIYDKEINDLNFSKEDAVIDGVSELTFDNIWILPNYDKIIEEIQSSIKTLNTDIDNATNINISTLIKSFSKGEYVKSTIIDSYLLPGSYKISASVSYKGNVWGGKDRTGLSIILRSCYINNDEQPIFIKAIDITDTPQVITTTTPVIIEICPLSSEYLKSYYSGYETLENIKANDGGFEVTYENIRIEQVPEYIDRDL